VFFSFSSPVTITLNVWESYVFASKTFEPGSLRGRKGRLCFVKTEFPCDIVKSAGFCLWIAEKLLQEIYSSCKSIFIDMETGYFLSTTGIPSSCWQENFIGRDQNYRHNRFPMICSIRLNCWKSAVSVPVFVLLKYRPD
jgi:hypothetical protein